MTVGAEFNRALEACPLVAILRGVRPDEVEAIGEALVEAGFTLIEVPLNSPDPLSSIRRLAQHLGDRALVGAGTVLTSDQVSAVRDVGGRLIVSPNTNAEVIARTVRAGLDSLPGFQTPSEAFDALVGPERLDGRRPEIRGEAVDERQGSRRLEVVLVDEGVDVDVVTELDDVRLRVDLLVRVVVGAPPQEAERDEEPAHIP